MARPASTFRGLVKLSRCNPKHVTGGKLKLGAALARSAGLSPGDWVGFAWIGGLEGARPRLAVARLDLFIWLDRLGCFPPGPRWFSRAHLNGAKSPALAVYVPGFPTGTPFSLAYVPVCRGRGMIYMTPRLLGGAPQAGGGPADWWTPATVVIFSSLPGDVARRFPESAHVGYCRRRGRWIDFIEAGRPGEPIRISLERAAVVEGWDETLVAAAKACRRESARWLRRRERALRRIVREEYLRYIREVESLLSREMERYRTRVAERMAEWERTNRPPGLPPLQSGQDPGPQTTTSGISSHY